MFDYIFVDFVARTIQASVLRDKQTIEEAVYMQISRLLSKAEDIYFIV